MNTKIEVNLIEKKMRQHLTSLGLGQWHVRWLPDSSHPIRGRVIPEKLMIKIYDFNEDDAWDTFIHEVVEIKMRLSLRPYRILVNSLIGVVQEIADGEKDRFIESLPAVFEDARDSPPSS